MHMPLKKCPDSLRMWTGEKNSLIYRINCNNQNTRILRISEDLQTSNKKITIGEKKEREKLIIQIAKQNRDQGIVTYSR